ncbi:hypothetical protein CsSME_00013741 [Camellia sinensis var. sinensis]
MPKQGLQALLLLSLSIFLFTSSSAAIRIPTTTTAVNAATKLSHQQFREAPKFYNSAECPSIVDNDNDVEVEADNNKIAVCSESAVHVAMTLDTAYIRGSMAAILSVLQHSSCPQNIFFHFVASASADASLLRATISTSFPYLKFQIYPFDDSAVARLISTSIRSALDCPLNYARSYLSSTSTPTSSSSTTSTTSLPPLSAPPPSSQPRNTATPISRPISLLHSGQTHLSL